MTSCRHAVSPLWVLCLVLMGLPGVGLATQDVPRAVSFAASREPEGGNFKNSLLDESREEPERYRAPRELRLLTEVGAGLVTAIAGGVAGMLIGDGLCMRLGWDPQPLLRCFNSLVTGLILGASVGYGLGVWWGGEAVGGDGRWLFTMLGTAAGLVVTGALATLRPSDPVVSTLLLLPIPLGSHLGYELSQRAEPSSSALSARPGFQPLLGFSSQGALLGLGGRF